MAQRVALVHLGFYVPDSEILSMTYGSAAIAQHPSGYFQVSWLDPGEGWRTPESTRINEGFGFDSHPSRNCLKMRLVDGDTQQLVDVLYVDAAAFRWQAAHHVLVPGFDNDDASYEVYESDWLGELADSNELPHADYRHFKTNFNETWGSLEVVCRSVLAQTFGAPAVHD